MFTLIIYCLFIFIVDGEGLVAYLWSGLGEKVRAIILVPVGPCQSVLVTTVNKLILTLLKQMKGSHAWSTGLTSFSWWVTHLIKSACSLLSEWEGKAGLRPQGTCSSPAYSAQSLSPCLFVERLIKECSALRGFTTSGSFWADEHGHPIMFPSRVHWGMWLHTPWSAFLCATVSTPVSGTSSSTAALNAGFSSRLKILQFGWGEWMMMVSFWSI